MNLRFRGTGRADDAARFPFVCDERYEVAEIFEMPGHVMVRRPGDQRWPPPGSNWFGWPPQVFEQSDKPIPIVSCGFRHDDLLTDFFGVILTQTAHVEAIEALSRVRMPDEADDDDAGEHFDAWRREDGAGLSADAARALYELTQLMVDCHFGVYRHVFLADLPISSSFAYAGCFLADLARFDVGKAEFEDRLARLLNLLEIRGFETGEIDLPLWQGTTGGERLINPPPEGRLIYGTENPADMLEHEQ